MGRGQAISTNCGVFEDAPDQRGETFALTIPEVRDEWNRMSGENLSRARVWQIIRIAEDKLRRALRQEHEA